MFLQIHATTNGPVVIHEGRLIVLADDDALIQLCEHDESALFEIENHILSELGFTFNEYMDAVSSNLSAPNQKLYSYISAVQQFLIFKNFKWPQYQMAIRQAEEGEDGEYD